MTPSVRCSVGPVLDDLDREGAPLRDDDRLGQDPDGRAADDRRLDVAPARRRGLDPAARTGAGRDGWIARREDRLAVGTEDHRVGPRSAAAEDEAVAGRVLGVRALALDVAIRASSWVIPAFSSEPAAATYSATASAMRMSRVVPPLHRTRLRRTCRSSRLSAVSAASSGALGSVGGGIPSGIGQTIAHAADGLDQPARRTELVAQVVDVGIDRVRRDRHAERPGLVEELVARQRLAGMAEQALEQRELARAEVDRSCRRGSPAATVSSRTIGPATSFGSGRRATRRAGRAPAAGPRAPRRRTA